MCGRSTYFPSEFSDLRLTWDVGEVFDLEPRYNIAPTQEAPVIVHANGKRTIELFQWGLISSWAKDPAIGNKMINTRGETIAEKPSFKWLLARHRCLVLADGFYEWRKEGKGKVPMRFKLLGHASVNTTQIYTTVSTRKLKALRYKARLWLKLNHEPAVVLPKAYEATADGMRTFKGMSQH